MRVHPYNDLALRGQNPRIECAWDDAAWILQQADERMTKGIPAHNFRSSICAHSVNHEDFKGSGWKIIRKNRVKTGAYMLFFIARRDYKRNFDLAGIHLAPLRLSLELRE